MTLLNWFMVALNIVLSLTCAGHALFFKKTPATALVWISVCIVFPFAGSFLYFLFGINRVQTRARKLDSERQIPSGKPFITPVKPEFSGALNRISKISHTVTRLPLVSGNHIDLLHNGETAYPAMIKTIESAQERIFLATYIFDTSPIGRRFINALSKAAQRGLQVRVIIDGVGELYSIPRARILLEKNGVQVARYLPPRLFPPMLNINLRNHRKLLVADGDTGYTGGMNISDKNMCEKRNKKARLSDTHFRLTGPVTRQLEHAFIEDWAFCAKEDILPSSHPAPVSGNAICRVITDGPHGDINKLETILIGAVTAAVERICIMTPYFLPSLEMTAALRTAALKGVTVDIVLPKKNNLPIVRWAMNRMLSDFLKEDVHVFFQPPPFVHSKLFVVDGKYAQIGSANLDPRSLRLNFELNVEIYDETIVKGISGYLDERIAMSRRIELKDIRDLPVYVKTRDALAWLFSPYL